MGCFVSMLRDSEKSIVLLSASSIDINTITSNALDFVRTKRTIKSGNNSLEMELNSL